MSSQISAVQQQDPDVIFTSFWGGDVTTFLQQGVNNGLFEGRTVAGTILYSAADDMSESLINDVRDQADHVLSGSRNFYWNAPDTGNWPPGTDLMSAVEGQSDVSIPTAHYLSGYGAVTAWATAVEKAIEVTGGYPSQEQIAATLEGHGFFTPAGYHVMGADHQGMSNAYSGDLGWDGDFGGPVLTDVNTYAAKELSPPPGMTSESWIDSWA
jgi:branched-chain amino acid transport system substrate-binding protein